MLIKHVTVIFPFWSVSMNAPWTFLTIRSKALLRPGSNIPERSMSVFDHLWPFLEQKISETCQEQDGERPGKLDGWTFAKSLSRSLFKNQRTTVLFWNILTTLHVLRIALENSLQFFHLIGCLFASGYQNYYKREL